MSVRGANSNPALSFGRLAASLGLLLGACLPAAAQNSLVNTRLNATPAETLPARLYLAPSSAAPGQPVSASATRALNSTPRFSNLAAGHAAPVSMSVFALPAEPSILTGQPGFSAALITAPRNFAHQNHNNSLESSVDFTETPYAQNVRMPVATVAGGKVNLGGFYRFMPTENVMWGLPGAGSLPAWSVSTQSHPGMWAPQADESFGVNLTIRLSRDNGSDQHPQLFRCLGWVVGVRGCHLLN